MLQKLLNNKGKFLLVLFIILLLAGVRAFEDQLFYDPFSMYFKNDYLTVVFPKYNGMPLLFAMAFRYFLNAMLSLAIIYLLFSNIVLTRFAAVLYLIFFGILIISFFLLLRFSDNSNNFLLFYVRRFLIQPLFLLLFVPAFYYQKKQEKK